MEEIIDEWIDETKDKIFIGELINEKVDWWINKWKDG